MCWTQHCAWTCSLGWPDSCLLQLRLLEITCVPKHRSGPPPHRSASRVPFICSGLQNSVVKRRAPREILSSDAMYYKEYMGTLMVLTPITLSWRKFSFFCPFISSSYFCFSFPAFIIFFETLCLYHFLSFKLNLPLQPHCTPGWIYCIWNEMEPGAHHTFCIILIYIKLIISIM